MIGNELERRVGPDAGHTDAVTFSFASDGWFGMARLGLSAAAEGLQGSALAVLFHERDPVAAAARGGLALPDDADWAAVAVDTVSTAVDAPLERWTVRFEGDDGGGFDLSFAAESPPAVMEAAEPAARLGAMEGYEQLCRVHGTVRAAGREVEVRGVGQRGHSWGAPDWERLELARSVSVWLQPDDGAVVLSALRPSGAAAHAEEEVWAAVLERGEPVRVLEPRLSTTYDGDGRQRRAGLELWVREDDPYPFRAAGEVVCGSTLELGQLRLDLGFMRWHAADRESFGRYDVLRRA